MKVFAKGECIDVPGPFGKAFCGELAPDSGGGAVLAKFAKIISRVIGVVTLIAGLYFLMQLFIAAFSWISSGGDAQKISDAQSRITNAFIGLVLVVGALAIMGVIETFFGIPFLNLPEFADELI